MMIRLASAPPNERTNTTVERRFPRLRDLAPLMRFKAPELNAKKRRLESALTI
jgi:hypothetical protein